VFDDVSRLAGDAAAALGGFKGEIETAIKQRLERMLTDLDLVRREEFEAVRAMAAAAREEQEKLAIRLTELEAAMKPAAKKPAAKKPAAKPAPAGEKPQA
jgi:BMFP domain-containing protein YqiC